MRTMDASCIFLCAWLVLTLMPLYASHDYFLLILIGSLLLPAVGELMGLYQPWRGRSLYNMLGIYALSWFLTIVLLSLLLLLLQHGHYYSRVWMGVAAVVALVVGSGVRVVLYLSLRSMRAAGKNQKHVLLIGHADNLALLAQKAASTPHAGYTVQAQKIDQNSGHAFLLEIDEIASNSVFKREFDEIWLGYPLSQGERVREIVERLTSVPVSVRYFPELPDVRLLNHRINQVAGLYSIELNYTPLNGSMRLIKWLEDKLLGSLIFLLFLPIMLLTALAIRWQMGGPVLFKQERHGLDGKPFKIYKFRTMKLHDSQTTNGEATQDQAAQDQIAQGLKTEQARYNDARITPLGAFLRRTSLDELPQLYNVLQGRMSLVGPRPHALDHNDHYKDYIEHYMQRHRVKPGITGWAQVNGWRGSTKTLHDMKQRVEHDLYYIDNWSLAFDIKILAMTLTRGFFNKQP